jgi:hypothetical protein
MKPWNFTTIIAPYISWLFFLDVYNHPMSLSVRVGSAFVAA